MKTRIYLKAKPGTPGRRALRKLNDEAVEIARTRAQDPNFAKRFIHPRRLRA